MSELKQIAEAFSGEIAIEKDMNPYEEATKVDHDFMFVDLHHKKNVRPSGFRQNFDTYLIPDENSEKT